MEASVCPKYHRSCFPRWFKTKYSQRAVNRTSHILILLSQASLDQKYLPYILKVKSMQRPGTEAIRTQIQLSKPKREITKIKIANSQNTKRTYDSPSDQLFPKRWPPSNSYRTKNNMNTRKVKRHRNSDTKNRQQRTTTKLLRNKLLWWWEGGGLKLVLGRQPRPQFLKWYKKFSRLFGSHDNPLTRQ